MINGIAQGVRTMTKQVIVMRKDLKMRRGKEIAQGAHAAMRFLVDILYEVENSHLDYEGCNSPSGFMSSGMEEWLHGSFTKVCLQVNSEEELISIFTAAKKLKLPVHMITDAGKTEFNGVPTKTCLAIGPADDEMIDKVTGHLKLY